MAGYVGVTDFGWFNSLASQPELEEVNSEVDGYAPYGARQRIT